MNKLKSELKEKSKSKAQNNSDNINLLQAIIKFFEGKAVETTRNLAISIPDSKWTLSDMDNSVQSLKVGEDIVFGDKNKGVQSLPVDDLDKGVQSLPLDEDGLLGEQVPSLNGHEAVVPIFEPSPSKLKKQRTGEENLAIV